MKRILVQIVLGLGAWALISPAAYAAGYLKIEGIKGESTHQGGDWINIDSLSLSADSGSSSATGSSRQRMRVTPADMTITKPVDSATPKILQAVAQGKVFPTVTVKFDEGGKSYKATMSNVRMTGFEQVTEGGAWPREHVSFSYQKITWDYSDSKGKTSATWDVKGGR